MPDISLSNSQGRDAQIIAESVRIPVRIRWVDDQDRQVTSARLLKGTIDRDLDALLEQAGSLDKIADPLIAGDPELDIESAGSFLRDTSRVYFNTDRKTVFGVTINEIVRNPDGTEKLRRPKKQPSPNVGAEQPLLWSGKETFRVEGRLSIRSPTSHFRGTSFPPAASIPWRKMYSISMSRCPTRRTAVCLCSATFRRQAIS